MCVERVEIKITQTRGSLAKENLRRWKFLISYVNSLTRETRDVKARRWNTTARFMTQSLFGNDFSSSRFRVFSALPGFVWLTTKNEWFRGEFLDGCHNWNFDDTRYDEKHQQGASLQWENFRWLGNPQILINLLISQLHRSTFNFYHLPALQFQALLLSLWQHKPDVTYRNRTKNMQTFNSNCYMSWKRPVNDPLSHLVMNSKSISQTAKSVNFMTRKAIARQPNKEIY